MVACRRMPVLATFLALVGCSASETKPDTSTTPAQTDAASDTSVDPDAGSDGTLPADVSEESDPWQTDAQDVGAPETPVDTGAADIVDDSAVAADAPEGGYDVGAAADASDDFMPPDAGVSTTGAWPQSSYASLPEDVTVSVDGTVLSTSVSLPSDAWVVVSSDGRYGPSGALAANVYITVDGGKVSNDSYIDWTHSTNPQQHCFNALGALVLDAGTHDVRLVADVIDGAFYVGSGTNLAVMVHPAEQVSVRVLGQDSAAFAYTTAGIGDGTAPPHDPVATSVLALPVPTDVVALASGRSYHAGSGAGTYGDAMWGIHLDGSYVGNAAGLWTVNDLWTGAETQAPMFLHAFLPSLAAGQHGLSLDASEFPWGGDEDTVQYRVGAGTRLITLAGGMTVRGSAPISQAQYDTTDYVGIGTDQGWPGVPAVGTDVVLSSADFDVPPGHSGVIMFVAKSRVQGDPSDDGGTVSLRLKLDGSFVGPVGIQQLAYPDAVSQRTIATSYLSAGAGALAPGHHTIQAVARADGSFVHLAMVKDLPLLWFD